MTMTNERMLTSSELQAAANFRAIFNQQKHSIGLTQSKLAEKMGITTDGISKYMTGKRAMSDRFVSKLSSVLKVSPFEIKPDFDLVTHSINEELQRLDEQQKSLVLQYIQTIK